MLGLLGAAAVALSLALPAFVGTPHHALSDFGQVSATVTEPDGTKHRLCLLHAETAQQRQRGLMGVTEPMLGGCDGMAFSFPEDTTSPFWMRNTPLPLSVAYFDAQGRLVSTVDMAPCGNYARCRLYRATGPYRYALEMPRGRLPEFGIVPGARLTLGPPACLPVP